MRPANGASHGWQGRPSGEIKPAQEPERLRLDLPEPAQTYFFLGLKVNISRHLERKSNIINFF
jgi:hypothetical protein